MSAVQIALEQAVATGVWPVDFDGEGAHGCSSDGSILTGRNRPEQNWLMPSGATKKSLGARPRSASHHPRMPLNLPSRRASFPNHSQ